MVVDAFEKGFKQ